MLNTSSCSEKLRNVLRADGVFSALSGLLFIFAAGKLSAVMGLGNVAGENGNTILIGVGILLLIYSAGLFRNAAREQLSLKEANAAAMMDIAWVLGSVILLFSNLAFSSAGWWFIAIAADVVAIFAIAKLYLLSRIKNSVQAQYEG